MNVHFWRTWYKAVCGGCTCSMLLKGRDWHGMSLPCRATHQMGGKAAARLEWKAKGGTNGVECVLLLQNVFCYYRMCSLKTALSTSLFLSKQISTFCHVLQAVNKTDLCRDL
eukprot:Tamp_37445.p1 GENE.Tamp_37445~~Tamp_37445.p1  ORF type:complete len:112 (+),score=2.11 Tamp_37445:167-502(+)